MLHGLIWARSVKFPLFCCFLFNDAWRLHDIEAGNTLSMNEGSSHVLWETHINHYWQSQPGSTHAASQCRSVVRCRLIWCMISAAKWRRGTELKVTLNLFFESDASSSLLEDTIWSIPVWLRRMWACLCSFLFLLCCLGKHRYTLQTSLETVFRERGLLRFTRWSHFCC